jgi:NADH:ubiquinone oxidoreductase subunit 6 (subunit J)
MLDIKVVDSSFNFLQQSFFAYFGCAFFFLLMIFPISQSIFSINQSTGLSFYFIDWFSENSSFSNLVSLGLLLYTHYFIFFLIAGFILLIAVFGVLMLLLSLNKNSPSADSSALSKKQGVKKMFKLNVFFNF